LSQERQAEKLTHDKKSEPTVQSYGITTQPKKITARLSNEMIISSMGMYLTRRRVKKVGNGCAAAKIIMVIE
jgi:hypothetical protein